MRLWEERVVPRLVDWSLRAPEIGELRTDVCTGLRGEVLEVGFGSGLNTRFYPADVSTVSAVEPSDLAWRLSERRRTASSVPVVRVGLDGQRLAADDASYDSVLSTFTLCTIPDVSRALAEVRRVLRPGGSLHFVEHGLAPEPGVVVWQRRLDPVQRRLAGGCHLSRDIPALVRDAGLEIEELRAEYLPGPRVSRPWTYGYLGRAAV
ncbi:MAG: class I SAM-dependent methyltransferase [Nocardioides sp.]|jgi:SAM-dependent methyltransferase